MSKQLNISETLKLPLDFVTQTQAILAKRGVGKSYTASVEAEELLKHGQQIVVIDPTGAWHGLRSSADGKKEGYPIVIFGGEHADVSLEEHAGEVIARAIVEQRFSAIIDLSLFRKGQMMRFMVDFAETLYRLNRDAMHLFVDEADAVAPQARNYGGEENRLLGAMEDIVRRGRKRGIGCTLITQRPAVLNKNVLTQCEILVALRLVHPKDIDAIKEWVNVHADPEQAKEMIASLPSLPVGTAWFWSPGWGDIFAKARIRTRETFDSGATPKAGQKQATAKVLARIDIERLGSAIRQSVEQAKANDPKVLRKRIAELEHQLSARPAETRIQEKIVEVPVLKNGQLDRTHKIIDRMQAIADKCANEAAELRRMIAPAFEPKPAVKQAVQVAPPQPSPVAVVRTKPVSAVVEGPSSLPRGERAILTACAQYADGVQRVELTVLTGYKRSSRDTYIQRLGEKGYVVARGDRIHATEAGIESLGDFQPLPTGDALRAYWMQRLPQGERFVLEVLAHHWPNSVSREAISQQTGYQRSSRDTYLQRMAAKRLVVVTGPGEVKASDSLFG